MKGPLPRALLWVAGLILLAVAVDAALLHSKEPVFLFWSAKKLLYCTGLSVLGASCIWVSSKMKLGELHISPALRSPVVLFLAIQSLTLPMWLATPASIGGDLGQQAVGLTQFVTGQVDQFNAMRIPIEDWDLARDRVEPIVWFPPGPMILLLPLLKLGMSVEWAARVLLLAAYCCGGLGFLALVRKLGLSSRAQMAFSAVLALAPWARDGLGIISPTSSDNLGIALFPWLVLAALHLVQRLQDDSGGKRICMMYLLTGLGVGALYWVKYSWFVAGAALAGFLGIAVFVLIRKTPIRKRIACMALFAAGFFAPFLGLNQHNANRAGHNALQYSESGKIGDNGFVNMVYGPNFSATARPQELPFSALAGPGFILGGNILATKVVNLAKNVPAYNQFIQERGTNTHVWTLILVCLPMTLAVAWLLRRFSTYSTATHVWLLAAMALIPIALLAYLSLQSGFNFVIKDNYRYVIPYSFLFQALLLDAWFRRASTPTHPVAKAALPVLLFWVILFPCTWAVLQARPDRGPRPDTTHSATVEQLYAASPQGLGITFFLNGHGPRAKAHAGRSVNVPFLLDGGIENDPEGSTYHTSRPIRVVVAIEANLTRTHPAVLQFLNRFPDARWQQHTPGDPVFPLILYTDIKPATPSNQAG